MRPIALCLILVACAARTPAPDTARLRTGAFGTLDPGIGAVNQAQYAFAAASRLRDRPSDAARSIAALEYLAGEIGTGPRWAFVSPLTKLELLDARRDMRAAVGILPAARSQDVTRTMLALADAIDDGDPAAEALCLSAPIYAIPARTVRARLAALPFLPRANVATQRLAGQVSGLGGGMREE